MLYKDDPYQILPFHITIYYIVHSEIYFITKLGAHFLYKTGGPPGDRPVARWANPPLTVSNVSDIFWRAVLYPIF